MLLSCPLTLILPLSSQSNLSSFLVLLGFFCPPPHLHGCSWTRLGGTVGLNAEPFPSRGSRGLRAMVQHSRCHPLYSLPQDYSIPSLAASKLRYRCPRLIPSHQSCYLSHKENRGSQSAYRDHGFKVLLTDNWMHHNPLWVSDKNRHILGQKNWEKY